MKLPSAVDQGGSRIGAADLPKFDVYVPCFEAMPVNLVVLMRAECVDGTG